MSTPKAEFVKALVFKGEAPREMAETYLDVASIFPFRVSDLLSNLSRYSEMYTLIVDINLHFYGYKA